MLMTGEARGALGQSWEALDTAIGGCGDLAAFKQTRRRNLACLGGPAGRCAGDGGLGSPEYGCCRRRRACRARGGQDCGCTLARLCVFTRSLFLGRPGLPVHLAAVTWVAPRAVWSLGFGAPADWTLTEERGAAARLPPHNHRSPPSRPHLGDCCRACAGAVVEGNGA
ncbi:hypothetical protein NDU88_001571 [Pleurodeles waltl]|uniref:Uncharacterized protein n=1 Tax=Pleurodeles waltl TaxID=8319 RepID=A0AAV7LDJ3_PLEWA|nr:hypothetical protein NDU88_001571 [Pleurodeles waltl]